MTEGVPQEWPAGGNSEGKCEGLLRQLRFFDKICYMRQPSTSISCLFLLKYVISYFNFDSN